MLSGRDSANPDLPQKDCHVHLVPVALRDVQGIRGAGFHSVSEVRSALQSGQDDFIHAIGVWNAPLTELATHLVDCEGNAPAYIGHLSGHQALINQSLRDHVDASGGESLAGKWWLYTGEDFNRMIEKVYGLISTKEKRAALEEFIPEVKRRGFTEVHCFDGFGPEGEEELELVAEYSDEELNLVPVPGFEHLDFAREHDSEYLGGDFWLDGSITAGTAALSENDADLFFSDSEVTRRLAEALGEDFTPTLHAIGDRAIDQALRCLSEARELTGRPGARMRVEHASAITEEQLRQCRDEGVILSMQPGFNRMFGEQYENAVGEERAANLNPVSRALELGCEVLLGSDSFVTPMRKDWIYPPDIRDRLKETA